MSPEAARLAPDPGALAAARQIAVRHLWPVLGRSERALWGEVLGSERYLVSVDLGANVTRCTCPSRKLPCKHALALMLLAADGLALRAEPDDVARWMDRRAQAATKERGPVKDLEAQAERREQREARVRDGVERLGRVLDDVVRQGLGSLDAPAGLALLDVEARRLVDAQAPGLAGRVRGIAQRIEAGGDWAGDALARLGRLALVCEAHARLEAAPDEIGPGLAADVRAAIGFSTSEEDVRRHGDVVTDTWLVLADVIELDGPLRVGRTWLVGRGSGRGALVLRFAPVGVPFATLAHWLPGHDVAAPLAFYPSARPERALVVEVADPEPTVGAGPPDPRSVAGLLEAWADALARAPLVDRMAVIIGPVGVTHDRLFDDAGALPLVVADPPELLAVAGGGPVTLAGLWDGARLQALGAWVPGEGRAAFHPLTARAPAPLEPASTWADLAVVGSAKRKLPDDLPLPEGGRSPERRLLLAAVVEALRRSAGHLPSPPPSPLPPPPAEERPPISRRLADLVAPFFGEAHHPLVDEALVAIDARGQRLPPDLIVKALVHAAPDRGRPPEARADRRGTLGARGRWLASLGLFPDWTRAYADAPDDDPTTTFLEASAPDRRERALAALRLHDRPAARALLVRTWKEDKPELRERWLGVLGRDPGPDDVAFFEPVAGHDRSLPVRRRARWLLGRIPGTAVYERHRARLAAIVNPLSLPADPPDPDWHDDGVGLAQPLALGPRALLLAGLVASAPLDLQAEVAALGPEALVDTARASGHAHAWLVGALHAPPDARWAPLLAAAIPAVSWPRELEATLRDQGRALFDTVVDGPLADRLAARWYAALGLMVVTPWGPELSRAVLIELERTRHLPSNLTLDALHPSALARALELEPVRRAPRIAAALELRRRLHAELSM
ncbi:MAG: SWIM zinc finger family protein [Deltaproteobacteria bacterium]|nr:SWIM zinc finger family protein [Deltaproteobacteria bacterium]